MEDERLLRENTRMVIKLGGLDLDNELFQPPLYTGYMRNGKKWLGLLCVISKFSRRKYSFRDMSGQSRANNFKCKFSSYSTPML